MLPEKKFKDIVHELITGYYLHSNLLGRLEKLEKKVFEDDYEDIIDIEDFKYDENIIKMDRDTLNKIYSFLYSYRFAHPQIEPLIEKLEFLLNKDDYYDKDSGKIHPCSNNRIKIKGQTTGWLLKTMRDEFYITYCPLCGENLNDS